MTSLHDLNTHLLNTQGLNTQGLDTHVPAAASMPCLQSGQAFVDPHPFDRNIDRRRAAR